MDLHNNIFFQIGAVTINDGLINEFLVLSILIGLGQNAQNFIMPINLT